MRPNVLLMTRGPLLHLSSASATCAWSPHSRTFPSPHPVDEALPDIGSISNLSHHLPVMSTAGPSRQYGCAGELWNSTTGRLVDWSYAGYMAGELPIPDLPATGNLKTVFGARGDGVTDDTAALEAAIMAVEDQGVIFIPNGTYIITRRLDIPKRVVLQGDCEIESDV